MQRFQIIAVAVVLAIIGAVAPIAIMLHVSWTLAVKAEHDRLAAFANRAITRANRSYAETKDALHAIHRSDAEPCSTPHIERMRTLTIDTSSVHEIGYFENGLLKCTSWGATQARIEQAPGDYTTPDGLEVTINMEPIVSNGKPMMAIQYKNHNALVDRMRFVDVIVDPGIRLAIASAEGNLIATLNAPNPDLLKSIIARPRNGMDRDNLFAVARGDGWIAIATQSRSEMLTNLRREQMLLLPIGAFIAVFIVGIVVWLSKKRLSPLGELTIAVQNREFIAHYQPIVELKTGRCVGAEALVRWRRPDGSIVRPDLFVPLAEESGLITAITDQVIDTVIADLNELLVAERSLHVAINLCADDVKTGRVLPVIQNALGTFGHLATADLARGHRARFRGHRLGTHDHRAGARARIFRGDRRLRNRILEPAVSARAAVGCLEDRQILHRHDRPQYRDQLSDLAHHRHGQGAAPLRHRRRRRDGVAGVLSALPTASTSRKAGCSAKRSAAEQFKAYYRQSKQAARGGPDTSRRAIA